MTLPVLAIRGLSKFYRGRQVVNAVDLDVQSGTVVGLLGPNGAGKTTTFYMAVGIVRPDAGEVLLDDVPLTHDPMFVRARKGIGYLPQETSIFAKLTVYQNIEAVLEFFRIKKTERRDRVQRLLEELGIDHLADQRAGVLSGGQKRRLEISRALAMNPKFILLDEPFAGVDPLAVNDIRKIIGHLKEKGIGILISDHSVRETLGVCDHAYILNAGELMVSGSPEAIAASDTARRIYLGEEFKL